MARTTSTDEQAKTEAPVEDVKPTQDEDTLRRLKITLRAAAEREVVGNHREEFHQIAERKFAENGLAYRHRRTKEEKAEQEFRRLLAEHPDLVNTITGA